MGLAVFLLGFGGWNGGGYCDYGGGWVFSLDAVAGFAW